MDPENKVVETETTEEEQDSAPSQEKPKRSEAETAAYNLKRQADKAKELGLDPAAIIGATAKIESGDEDDTPVTVGMLKNMEKQAAQKTALDLAASIEDEDTRTLVTQYLNDNIRPSGNAEADFKLALAAAAAPKNAQVLKEINRYGTPKRTAAGGSAPAKTEEEYTPTAAEQALVQGFGFSPEKQKQVILKARADAAAKG